MGRDDPSNAGVRDGIVLRAIVNGDWHPRPLEAIDWLELALAGVPAEADDLQRATEAFLAATMSSSRASPRAI